MKKMDFEMKEDKVLMLHTSPAAIMPLKKYYQEHAPDLQLVNILDDGLLDLFRQNKSKEVDELIVNLILSAQSFHQVSICLITCSAVNRSQIANISSQVTIPVIKVDLPMLEAAVAEGSKLGVIASFPPGAQSSLDTIQDLSREMNKLVDVDKIFVPEAYDALLQGDVATHDQMILNRFHQQLPACDVYILTQVSLAHLQHPINKITGKPVFSSPAASLKAVKKKLDEQ